MKNVIFPIFLALLFFVPEAFAQSISIASGNGQVVREQFLSVPLVVQVKDAAGNPSAGIRVTWAVTQGSGSLVGQSGPTDSNGLASVSFVGTSIQPGSSFVSNAVTATSPAGSVVFQITTTLGQGFALPPLVELIKPSQASRSLTGPAGSVLPDAIEVQVTAQSGTQQGQPVPNVSVRIVNNTDPTGAAAAVCNVPGGTVLTNSAGRAVCDVKLTGAPGSYALAAIVGEYQYTPAINLTISDAPVCTFAVSLPGTAFGGAAATGTFTVTTTSGCGWTAGSNAGWITLNATSGSGTGSVTFNVAANTAAARSGTIQVAGQTFIITQGTGAGSGPLTITSPAALPSATLNTLYAFALIATGGQAPYLWSAFGNLPTGLSLNSSTGVVSGTPAALGSYSIAASVTDATGTVKMQTFTLTVVAESAGPVVTNGIFPNGVIGQAYLQKLTSFGGCASPFSPVPTFTLSSGVLPAGLTLVNAASGFSIAGTPTLAGTSSFALTVRDACGRSSSSNFTLTVTGTNAANSIVVSPSGLTFNVQQGADRPPLQTLFLSGTNSAALNFTAVVSAPLLTLSSSAGTTPSALMVGIGTTALALGVYNASIAISSPGVAGVITFPVTVNVTPGTSLTVSPNALAFRDATPQILAVNSGGPVHFTATAFSNSNWLLVNPSGGDTPGSLSVSVNLTGLTTGSYNGSITLSPVGGTTIVVPVNLVVPPPATLDANPRAITFTHTAGSELAQPFRSIIVASSGPPLNFTLSADQPWIVVNPASGTAPARFGISVLPAGLAPGVYTGKVQLSPGPAVSVTLTIVPALPQASVIVSAASFLTGPVAPGEIITIFGSNFGPAIPAGLRLTSAGTVDTLLSETRVSFDGAPAPLVYVSQSQISAIAPYEIYGRASTKIQVEYKGARTDAIEMQVAGAIPAIFPGAVLNQDFSPNSPRNSAEPGSIIVFYATGEGQTDPRGYTGAITGDLLPKPLLNVGVQIGGRTAEILYAGAAPGLPSGVIQVNARVPDDTTRGVDVPLFLIVGDARSPSTASVSIRP